MKESFVITISCADKPGIVASITTVLFSCGANIIEANQFEGHSSGQFFMRIVFTLTNNDGDIDVLKNKLGPTIREFEMDFQLRSLSIAKKVLLLVSKQDHCLGDLLYRFRIGEMKMNVVGVVSNHPKESLNISTIGDIPYHHLPITPDTKPQQENQIKNIINNTGAELVVLARYMQILSDDMANYLQGRCINIHHSSLPGFKGAKPYHQAYQRGVKLIGATAHFVTADLDEGPIIEQDVEPITHADTPDDLVRKGRDIERRVLAKAVSYCLEDRVLVSGRKTVVFKH